MHGSKGNDGGNIWIPSDRLEFVGPNKEKNKAEWERTKNSKPNTQLGSSSSTSASSSKGKDKK